MKRWILWLLVLVLWAPAHADPEKKLAVIVVGKHSDGAMASRAVEIATRLKNDFSAYGLDPSQLPLGVLDLDDDAVRSKLANVHVSDAQLPCVLLLQLGTADTPAVVLFRIENVEDAEKSAQAALRTARGLLGGGPAQTSSSAPSAVPAEDPRKSVASVNFYSRLLRDPSALGFHPDAGLVQSEMASIRDHYVDPISDTQMESGIVQQVRDLLQSAAIPADKLEHLPLDDNLPGAVLAAYGGQVDRDALAWAEVRGVLEPLDDPYTSLLTPKQTQGLNNLLNESSFPGVGIQVEADRRTHQFVIVDTVDDGPAARAGVLPGDSLVKVDNYSTDGLSADLVSGLLRGAVGTTVHVTVRRGGTFHDFAVTRAVVTPRTVTSEVLPDNIGYIHLRTFAANSATEVEAVLLKWKMARAVKGVILDLRNDGGGYVKTAQELCSLFLDKGEPVVWFVFRGGKRQLLPSNGPGDYGSLPMVLLVNNYSASASEITAGCLKDNHKATLVGVRTFGKGSMQQPYDFPNHTEFKVTIAHFYSPRGMIIDRLGVAPDVEVPMEATQVGTSGDVQLQKAIEVMRNKLQVAQ